MAFWNRSSSNTLTDVDILSCWPRGVENDEEKFYLILPGFYMILTSLRTVHTFLASPACKAVFLAEDLRKKHARAAPGHLSAKVVLYAR